jgi:hypothetical protein
LEVVLEYLENMHASNSQKFFLGIAAMLVVVSSAFSPTVGLSGATKSSLTELASSSSSSSSCESDRRGFLVQAGVLAGAIILGPGSAQAGLLDEYGNDPSKIALVEKPKEVIAAVVKKADVQIDPTLRACKFTTAVSPLKDMFVSLLLVVVRELTLIY